MINGSLRNSPDAFVCWNGEHIRRWQCLVFSTVVSDTDQSPVRRKMCVCAIKKTTFSVRIKTSAKRKGIEKCYLVFKIMSGCGFVWLSVNLPGLFFFAYLYVGYITALCQMLSRFLGSFSCG